ncbi:hypothetical protein K437DRAFT_104977 [Tilletiaria anomala UBC 951]|uniref:Apple domain-containing protein n=1 Tax=Tilletiaria anomala (strain ATCC 24038 / CBS 436.72 / UBC 951) TaxID=1037660 RepID=A0A066W7S9_TILAU|nr:uncharacterized protein K437DRAFT_104977 [Tilletiaria anomala UBC 951]KDN46815.1 hypothetical protein K437DRAFT_104977 [Tilletiaria anomala UBC 951]
MMTKCFAIKMENLLDLLALCLQSTNPGVSRAVSCTRKPLGRLGQWLIPEDFPGPFQGPGKIPGKGKRSHRYSGGFSERPTQLLGQILACVRPCIVHYPDSGHCWAFDSMGQPSWPLEAAWNTH